MKMYKTYKTMMFGAMLTTTVCGIAATIATDKMRVAHDFSAMDKPLHKALEAEVNMTQADSVGQTSTVVPFEYGIHTQVRSYGDSVKIRWAPNRYPAWKMLNEYGYDIIRLDLSGRVLRSDTVAKGLRPLSMEAFQRRFAANDSLAASAAQLIHAKLTTLDQTESAPGTMGSFVEVYEQQQTAYSFAMMVAELRYDVAEAMALAFTDRNVQRGHKYYYTVSSRVPKEVLPITTYVRGDFEDQWTVYKPEKFDTQLTDSLIHPSTISLEWPVTLYSAYDIERRMEGESRWTLLNERPYVSMILDEDGNNSVNRFHDDGVFKPGTYQYRMRAYDSFGDKTAYGDPHTVVVPDVFPPTAPLLRQITLNRDTKGNVLSADFDIQKDTMETDFIGYDIYYYNEHITEGQWLKLNKKMFAPTDTLCHVTFEGLETGMVFVAAVDTAGNMGTSMARAIHIADMVPPQPPTNLRAAVSPKGRVTMAWTAPEDKDIAGYRVLAANDTTHVFQTISRGGLVNDTIYFDSLALDNAQRYIYYQVKAVDHGGNVSEPSAILHVSRPNFDPPLACQLDSIWQTPDSLFMRWIPSSEKDVVMHRLYRRLGTEGPWYLVLEIPQDMVEPEGITVFDTPPFDQQNKWYYAMETYNAMGISSGLSTVTAFRHRAAQVVNIPITLYAQMRHPDNKQRLAEEKGEKQEAASKAGKDQLKLVWEVGKMPEGMPPYYFVLFRRSTDELFRGVQTLEQNVIETNDYRTKRGEHAEYYIKIRFKDGRESTPSNVVVVDNK